MTYFEAKKQQIENSLEENFIAQGFRFLCVSGEWTVLSFRFQQLRLLTFFKCFSKIISST